MKYAYVIDSKLVAYYLIQRGRSIGDIFTKVASLLTYLAKRGDIYMCFDLGHSDFRLAEQSYYKGHRRALLAKKSEAEQRAHAEFNRVYYLLPKIFEKLKVHTLAVEGVEADDLASIICKDLEMDPDMKVTLVSGDYDWCHMVMSARNVRLFDFPNNNMLYRHNVEAKYDLRSRREFSVLKSIVGDKSDNIKAINNLAAVKGRTFFDDVYEKYDGDPTDEQIIADLTELVDSKPNFSVHKLHVGDGRKTVAEVFTSNMKIADPFTDVKQMTKKQQADFKKVMKRGVGSGMTLDEFFNLSLDVVGYPIQMDTQAKKIFGVE